MSPAFFNAVAARGFATVVGLVAGSLSLWLYQRYLTPETYGVVLVAAQLMAYLPLLDGGFRTTLNRRLLAAEPGADELILFGQAVNTWLALMATGVALVVMGAYAFTPTALLSGQPLGFFLLLGVAAAGVTAGNLQANLLVGLHAQAELSVLGGVGALLNLGVLWAGLHAGAGVWAFPLGTLAMLVFVWPASLWLIRRRRPGLPFFSLARGPEFWRRFHEMKAGALALFRNQVATLVLFTVDVVIVGLACGAREAAVYGLLTRVFGIVRSVVQTSGEAAWPLVARQGGLDREFNGFLVRANAWIYGSVTGAALVTLQPFLGWFMGGDWLASTPVLMLIAARFLITGMASTVTYLLYGLGEFRLLSRPLERELMASVVLAVPGALWLGSAGVSGAFLLATAAGTLAPIYFGYFRAARLEARAFFLAMWWRAAAGVLVSAGLGWLALGWLNGGWLIVIAGGLACGAGIGAGLLVAALRPGAKPGRAGARITALLLGI